MPSRRDPLAAALHHGYASVALAVGLGPDGTLRLACDVDRDRAVKRDRVVDRGADGPAFRDAVLAPLAARRRYPTTREPLTLLVELATEPVEAYSALDAELRAYRHLLTRHVDGAVIPGPVTVLLTGPGCPRDLVATQQTRYAFVDGTFADVEAREAPPSLVPLVSEHVAARFGWDGRDELPAEERHLLRVLVDAAHADGRRVRFHGVPDRPRAARLAFWRELHAARVDLIGTGELAALARYLRRVGLTTSERGMNRALATRTDGPAAEGVA